MRGHDGNSVSTCAGRPWKDAERLGDIAQHLQMSGHIVVEAPNAELQTVPKPEGRELPALPQIFGGSMWGGASEGMVGTMPPPPPPPSTAYPGIY